MFCPLVIRLAVVPTARPGRMIAVASVVLPRGGARRVQGRLVVPGCKRDPGLTGKRLVQEASQ